MKNNFIACLLLFISSLFFTLSIQAQKRYTVAISPRLGVNTYGITGTIFINSASAVDCIFSMGHDQQRFLFTALYEEHYNVKNVTDRFKLFCGAGMHIGFASNHENIVKGKFNRTDRPGNFFIAGADGIFGIEYTLKHLPLNIGIDTKPNVDFINGATMFCDGGLRVGFVF